MGEMGAEEDGEAEGGDVTEARNQHYRTFARELVQLCKKFEADNLRASIGEGMLVAQFGPRGEVVAYDRTGEPTVVAADGSAWMNQQLRGARP